MGRIEVPRAWMMPRMRAYLSRAGYFARVSDVAAEILETARSVYLEALDLACPFAATVDVARTEPGLPLPEPLAATERVSLIVCTLGIGIDRAVEAMFARDESLRGLLLDAWASEAVEAIAANVDERLRDDHGPGTMRFAPGYPPFDIRHNRAWLACLERHLGSSTPVTVDSGTGILTPRKSILCAIGWKGRMER